MHGLEVRERHEPPELRVPDADPRASAPGPAGAPAEAAAGRSPSARRSGSSRPRSRRPRRRSRASRRSPAGSARFRACRELLLEEGLRHAGSRSGPRGGPRRCGRRRWANHSRPTPCSRSHLGERLQPARLVEPLAPPVEPLAPAGRRRGPRCPTRRSPSASAPSIEDCRESWGLNWMAPWRPPSAAVMSACRRRVSSGAIIGSHWNGVNGFGTKVRDARGGWRPTPARRAALAARFAVARARWASSRDGDDVLVPLLGQADHEVELEERPAVREDRLDRAEQVLLAVPLVDHRPHPLRGGLGGEGEAGLPDPRDPLGERAGHASPSGATAGERAIRSGSQRARKSSRSGFRQA